MGRSPQSIDSVLSDTAHVAVDERVHAIDRVTTAAVTDARGNDSIDGGGMDAVLVNDQSGSDAHMDICRGLACSFGLNIPIPNSESERNADNKDYYRS